MEPAPPDPVPPKNDPAAVTAEQLAKEHAANPRGANAKYAGKTLVVSGAADGPPLTISGICAFTFGGGAAANLKPEAAKEVATLLRRQTVRVRGKITGEIASPILVDCDVLEVTPLVFTKVTADVLFDDFAKNPNAAGKKYVGDPFTAGVYLHLTDARVAAVEKNGLLLTAPTSVAGKFQVRVRYLGHNAKPFSELKVGDAVSIKGESYFSEVGAKTTLMVGWAWVAP